MRGGVLLILAATAAATAQTRPDFSGVWQLNNEKSKVDVSSAWMRIHQSASDLTVNMRAMQDGREENQTMRLGSGRTRAATRCTARP
jgi:hypothetical protein